MREDVELEMVELVDEPVEAGEDVRQRSRPIGPVDPEVGHRPQGHRVDRPERADPDPRRPPALRIGALAELAQRPVGADELHRDDLRGEVAEALSGPVGGGRDRAGERLPIDVAEALQRQPALVEPPVQLPEPDPRLDLDQAARAVELEDPVEQVDLHHRAVGERGAGERVARARDLDPALGLVRLDQGQDQAFAGPRPGDPQRPAALLARPVPPAPADLLRHPGQP